MFFLDGLYNRYTVWRDRRIVSRVYKEFFGRELNWENPKRYTEKIQILKTDPATEKLWKYVDKIAVRQYVADTIGSQYLTKLYGVYTTAAEIDFDALPEKFVLKANHGSGWNSIVTDKKSLDTDKTRAKLDHWLTQNYYTSHGRERQYKLIQPKLFAEEYLDTSDKQLLDVKFFCFHGKAVYVDVIHDRTGETRKGLYELPWKKAPFTFDRDRKQLEIEKPKNFDTLLRLAEQLAIPFEQVRVDLYTTQDRIIFGELTFTASGGFNVFVPEKYDAVMGSYW